MDTHSELNFELIEAIRKRHTDCGQIDENGEYAWEFPTISNTVSDPFRSRLRKIDTRTEEQRLADELKEKERDRELSTRLRQAEGKRQWQMAIDVIGPSAEKTLDQWEYFGTPDEQQRQSKAVDAVKVYIADMGKHFRAGRNLVMFGPKGCGKDLMMNSCIRRFTLGAGKHVSWHFGPKLYLMLRESMRDGSDLSEYQLIDRLSSAPVLALSDPLPPSGSVTEYQSAAMMTIVDERCRMNRPIWVTVNVKDREELENRLGAMTVDRLLHNAVVVPCFWSSYREYHHTREKQRTD